MANKDIKANKNQETVYGDIGQDITARGTIFINNTGRKLTGWENNLQQTHNGDLIVIPEQEEWLVSRKHAKLAEAQHDAACTSIESRTAGAKIKLQQEDKKLHRGRNRNAMIGVAAGDSWSLARKIYSSREHTKQPKTARLVGPTNLRKHTVQTLARFSTTTKINNSNNSSCKRKVKKTLPVQLTAKKRKQLSSGKQISTLTRAGRRLREPVVSFRDIGKRLRKINRWMSEVAFPKVSPAPQCKQKMRVKNKIRQANVRSERDGLYVCAFCQDERLSVDTSDYPLPCLLDGH